MAEPRQPGKGKALWFETVCNVSRSRILDSSVVANFGGFVPLRRYQHGEYHAVVNPACLLQDLRKGSGVDFDELLPWSQSWSGGCRTCLRTCSLLRSVPNC